MLRKEEIIMTIKEFCEKHNIDFDGNTLEQMLFFTSLDKLYLEFTPEQAIEILKDFYVCADDIYNEMAQIAQENVNKLMRLFGEEPKDEEKNPKDCDA